MQIDDAKTARTLAEAIDYARQGVAETMKRQPSSAESPATAPTGAASQ